MEGDALMKTGSQGAGVLLRRTLSWWFALIAITTTFTLLSSPSLIPQRSLWNLFEIVLNNAAIALPFVAFVVGLAALRSSDEIPSPRGLRRVAVRVVGAATLLAAVSYGLIDQAVPRAGYADDASIGVDMETRYPFGPKTSTNLRRQLDAVDGVPAGGYSFSASRPLAQPPNWLRFRIHQEAAYPLFALPNALLGFLVALLTFHLPTMRRKHARWTAGLVSTVAFLAPAMFLSGWVRGSPERSGILAAWGPLVVPVVGLLVTLALARGKLARPSASAPRQGSADP